jgi:hypothetical protein
VAYCRLVNWGRKLCLDVRSQNCLSVILQPMRAMLPPVARGVVFVLVLFCSCDGDFSWTIWVELFVSRLCYLRVLFRYTVYYLLVVIQEYIMYWLLLECVTF